MKNQENQSNANLAEIQQMVMANSVRHQENRQAIVQMRLDHERDVKDLRNNASEREKEFDRIMRERREEDDRWWKKIRALQDEVWALSRETDRQIKETGQQIKETDRQMKETDKKIKELSARFSSTTGHIIEGLMSSSAIKMYEDKGFYVDGLCKNFKRKSKELNMEMELDVMLYNDRQIIVEEVKASCDRKDVDKFLQHMKNFKQLFSEYADKEVFGAIASVNYENNADIYAREQGLFVVRVSSDDIFTLDPFTLENLKRF